MGEFADMEIMRILEMGLDGEDVFCYAHREPTSKKCRFCGKEGLHWKKELSGWRLTESSGVTHVCDDWFKIKRVGKK